MRRFGYWFAVACVCFVVCGMVWGQSAGSKVSRTKPVAAKGSDTERTAGVDLKKRPTLYVVGYAHLDTEWRWEYPLVIREYLSKTMRNNFALFEKYPHYIFNFS